MKTKTLSDWQKRIWKQQTTHFKSHKTEAPYYFAFRAMAECGELGNAINKHHVYGSELNIKRVKAECGDVLYFLMLTASMAKADMNEILEATYRKVEARIKKKHYGRALK